MAPLVLLLIYMNFSQGQSADQEVLYGIGIKLCNLKCIQRGSCMSFAYAIDRLACHLSHKEAPDWTMRGFPIFPKKRDQISAGACSDLSCEKNTRCVERRRGGVACPEADERAFSSCYGTGAVNSSCSSDCDCQADKKFQCLAQTCTCVLGYSFKPANNRCVRRCKTYGIGFTIYQGPGLYENNDKVVTSASADSCLDLCVKEKTFNCISAEYSAFLKFATFRNPGS